jgi:uncharacterized protein YndB with AHSA1/START domain
VLKTIALVVVVIIAGILIFAVTKPDTFRVERSAVINAPPEKVFPLIDDFKRWDVWSPWEKKDPAMKRTFGPVTSGKGAHYAWEGNGDVGQGSMDITDSVAPSRIALKLDFVKPFEGHNTVAFALVPKGAATEVSWTMSGPAPFMSKVMQVFVNMDSMIGKDFEAGLANLKTAAEK